LNFIVLLRVLVFDVFNVTSGKSRIDSKVGIFNGFLVIEYFKRVFIMGKSGILRALTSSLILTMFSEVKKPLFPAILIVYIDN